MFFHYIMYPLPNVSNLGPPKSSSGCRLQDLQIPPRATSRLVHHHLAANVAGLHQIPRILVHLGISQLYVGLPAIILSPSCFQDVSSSPDCPPANPSKNWFPLWAAYARFCFFLASSTLVRTATWMLEIKLTLFTICSAIWSALQSSTMGSHNSASLLSMGQPSIMVCHCLCFHRFRVVIYHKQEILISSLGI